MGGEFQQHFLHAVPPVSEWSDLLEAFRDELLDWEIEAMEVEIAAMDDKSSGSRERHNITIRWHDKHTSCLWSQEPVNISSVPESEVAAAISCYQKIANPSGYRSWQPVAMTEGSGATASATASTDELTAAVTGSSGATACGDTRSSDDKSARASAVVDMAVLTKCGNVGFDSLRTDINL
jgi:hypothetical protein